ncbi:MAG: DUF3486 family protein [Sporomusaceae bacterium]|jgi:hypothetical protein|nr:DUF3486 family protein [Sporomusaceae bacterium]
MATRKSNRRHYKVEKLNCREMIDRMLAEGYIYEDIVEAVVEAGEFISKSSIQRYHASYEQIVERITKTREQMKVLIDAVRTQPGTDLAEAANQVMLQGLLTRIATANDEFDSIPLDKVGRLVASLERSAVAREKLKFQYDKGVTAAVERIMTELRAELANMPDILTALAAKLETIRTELTAGG